MKYQIIELDRFIICDGAQVRVYAKLGNPAPEKAPSIKMFRELAYIYPSEVIIEDSFESALEEYLDNHSEVDRGL